MRKELLITLLLFVSITCAFFYPLFKGFVPFPGDLLVGQYAPYNSYTFLGYGVGGYPHKAQGFDVLKLLYPAKEFAVESLKNGQIPFWNPYNFSGNPQLASMQAGVFYPFTALFLVLPFLFAWSFYIVIQPILAGLFTYLLLSEFNLSKKSSLLGALVYAFSSYMVVWVEYGNIGHTILWLPLALWLLYKNLKKPSLVNSIALIFVLTFSLLAGYIQLVIYLIIFLAAFLVFYTVVFQRKGTIKILLSHIPIFVVPVLLSAVQLLPAIELFTHSTRDPYSYDAFIKLLIPQFHIVSAFVPDFFGNPATRNYWLTGTYIERVSYIGIIPLFFAIYGFMQKRTAIMWFFAATLIVVFLLVFDTPITRLLYGLYMPPIISTGVPSRMMYLFCFAASILAAFGFDRFEKSKSVKTLLKTFAIMGGVYSMLWIFVFVAFGPVTADWIDHLAVSKRNLILPTVIFGVFALVIASSFRMLIVKRFVFILVFGLTMLELFYFFHKITPFAPKEAVYPQTDVLEKLKSIQGINRSWGYGSAYVEANIQTHEKIYTPHGYDALHIKAYGELLTASYNGKLSLPPRSEADIAPGFGEEDLRKNKYRQRMLNILGVKYILHKTTLQNPDYHTFPSEIYNLAWQGGEWQIFENKDSLPRAILVSGYIVEKDREKTIAMMMDEKFNLSEKVILEEPLAEDLQLVKDDGAAVEVTNYTPNKVVLKTQSVSDGLLFLSDAYFPGWKVSIDGRNDRIYKANYAFRAVPVEKGVHEVVFWYHPDSFDIGLKVSVVSAAILFLFLSGVYLKRPNV